MVKWVITIPAIWNDKAKQFMREAALEVFIVVAMFKNLICVSAKDILGETLISIHP